MLIESSFLHRQTLHQFIAMFLSLVAEFESIVSFVNHRKLSDLDCNGRLDGVEFCIAMCLIHHWLSGAHLPTSLPPPLITFYHQVMWPRLPTVSEEHVLKCRKVFEVFQKNVQSGKMIGKGWV